MARVTYSAEINELNGSVGGTTFQKNASGNIAKLKTVLVRNPSSGQIVSRGTFNNIVSLWSALSYSNKLLWNVFAVAHSKYDYWGRLKSLSGFNWFVSCNCNRYATGQSYFVAPPSYITPIACPAFKVFPLSSSLSFLFDVFADRSDYYLFVFATPPIRSLNLQSRKSLRLVKVFDADNTLYGDITADWENYFGLSYPSASNSDDYNILIAISCVHKVTGLAGSFYLDNQPLNLSLNPFLIGNSLSSLGQQFSQLATRGLVNCSSGILLSCFQGSGLIARSVDYGSSWSSLGTMFSQVSVNCLCYCGSGIVLAGTQAGALLLRSTDYGASWSSLGAAWGGNVIFSLCYCGSGIVLASQAYNGKILRSTDYGASWSDLGTLFSQTYYRCLCYCGNGIVLSGSSNGGKIIRSTDYGATWSDLGQQFSQTLISSLCYLGNGVVLAGTGNGGLLLRSTDYGASWTNLGAIGTSTIIYSLFHLGFGLCFAGGGNNGELLRSTDYGLTWTSLGQQFSEAIVHSFLFSNYSDFFFGTGNGGLLITQELL